MATGHVRFAGVAEKPRKASIEFVGEGLMPRVRASTAPPDLVYEAQLRPNVRYRAMVRNLPYDYYLKAVTISQHEMPPDNVVVNGLRGDMDLILSTAGGHIEGVLTNATNEPTRGSILLIQTCLIRPARLVPPDQRGFQRQLYVSRSNAGELPLGGGREFEPGR